MENFYKKIVRLFCALIPVKTFRRKCRDWLFAIPDKISMYFLLRNNKRYKPYNKFYKKKIPSKSVLVVEINTFHGITLPGYIHYFKELGYEVDVLLDYKNVIDQPLCRLKDKFRAFVGTKEQMLEILRSPRIKKYDFVFINTTFYYPGGLSVVEMIGRLPEGKYGTLMIEHNLDPYVKQFGEEKHIKDGTLFTLLGFRNTKMLGSNYVGKVKCPPKNNKKTRFVVVGTIYPGNKNFQMLQDAVDKLYKNGIENFEINVIGYGSLDGLTEQQKKFIIHHGQLDYPSMYSYLENSDFYLPLLDPDNKEHHKYLDNWVTGSSILIYAFAKPCLINQTFAPVYGLNDGNAIVYGKDLFAAMKQAITLSASEYRKKQESLKILVTDYQKISLKNLREQLRKMVKRHDRKQ